MFQPGEELAGGARQMLDAGLFDPHRLAAAGCAVPSSMTGMHVAAMARTGWPGLHDGLVLFGADVLEVDVRGAGGHAAFATQGGPFIAVAELARRLGDIVSDMSADGTPAACGARVLSAGRASDVLPERARLEMFAVVPGAYAWARAPCVAVRCRATLYPAFRGTGPVS